MMETLPRRQPKTIPAFLDDLHRSLHFDYHTVKSHIQSAHQHNKQWYDKQRSYSPFMVGDQVWLHVPVVKPGKTKKFTSQWRGLYTVIERVNKLVHLLRTVWSTTINLSYVMAHHRKSRFLQAHHPL